VRDKKLVDFWKSEEGLLARFDMLSEYATWRTVNGALQAYASEAGVKEFEWVTEITETTCNYCDGQSGRRYRIGQFMPQIPVHYFCRCHWAIIM
jgi:hypothetical protein